MFSYQLRPMTGSHLPSHCYPGKKIHTLADAAVAGQIIVLHCHLCRRTRRYLASDLAATLDPTRDAYTRPFNCARCGTSDYVRVKLRIPKPGDYGSLIIRRPGAIKQIRTWRNVRLGDPQVPGGSL